MSSKFDQIRPWSVELAALESLKKSFTYMYLRTIQNIFMTCWLVGERSLPFGLLVSFLLQLVNKISQEPLQLGSWNLYYWLCLKCRWPDQLLVKFSQSITELSPFSVFLIITQWNLVNKISQEPLKLGSWYLIHRLFPRCRRPD